MTRIITGALFRDVQDGSYEVSKSPAVHVIHPTAVTFGGQQEKKVMVAEKSFVCLFLFILFSLSHV